VHVVVHKLRVVLDHNDQNLTDAHHWLELANKLANLKDILGLLFLSMLLLVNGSRHELKDFDQVIFDVITYALLTRSLLLLLRVSPTYHCKLAKLASKFQGVNPKSLDSFGLISCYWRSYSRFFNIRRSHY
jgi:hypothetical protein